MIFKLVFFSLSVTLMLVLLKENYRSFAFALSLLGCTVIFLFSMGSFSNLKDAMDEISLADGVIKDSVKVIGKALLVAYLTSFGSDICTDAGEKAIANALEFSGKAIMFSIALPMLSGIYKSVASIIG